MLPRPLIALDLGATRVTCAVGLPRERAPGADVLGTALAPFDQAAETWLNDPLLVGRTIEQALDATGVTTDAHRALVSFSHPSAVSEQIRAMIQLADEPIAVRQQDLRRLETTALHQVLPVDREAVIVERLGCDGNGFQGVRDPRGLPATQLSGTFHLVTTPLAARRAMTQAVESAGLEVAWMTTSLQATAAALAADDGTRQHRCVLIDVGGLTTNLGLLIEGRLQRARTIRWGGVPLLREVASALGLTTEEALPLSQQGLASRRAEVKHAVHAGLEQVRQGLAEMLDSAAKPDGLLLAGRTALLDGVAEWLEHATKIPTRLARSPHAHGTDLAGQMALQPALGLLALATAAGPAHPAAAHGWFDRAVAQTRTLLTEYF